MFHAIRNGRAPTTTAPAVGWGRRPEVGLPPGRRHHRREALELRAAGCPRAPAVRDGWRPLRRGRREAEPVRQPRAHACARAPRSRPSACRRGARTARRRPRRAEGAARRAAQVDPFDGDLRRPHSIAWATDGLPGQRWYTRTGCDRDPTCDRAGDARRRADGLDDRGHHIGPAAFAEVGDALNERVHRVHPRRGVSRRDAPRRGRDGRGSSAVVPSRLPWALMHRHASDPCPVRGCAGLPPDPALDEGCRRSHHDLRAGSPDGRVGPGRLGDGGSPDLRRAGEPRLGPGAAS